jgi:hypothetical protein
MVKLIATKAHSYGTNFHKVGATYEAATDLHAKLMIQFGNAKLAEANPADELSELRAKYEALSGKKAHHLWKVARLAEEIAAVTPAVEPVAASE